MSASPRSADIAPSLSTAGNGNSAVATAGAPVKPGRRRVVRFIIGLALLIAVAFGIYRFVNSLGHESTDNAQINGQLDPVIPRVAGTVEALLVKDNDRVKAGQPLLRLQTHDLDVRIAGAEAALAQAQANVESMRANAVVAQANVTADQVLVNQERRDLERDEQLFRTGSIAQEVVETARADSEAAAAKHAALQRQAEAATAQITLATAAIAQRQSELDFAKLQRSYASITAPIDGVVSRRSVEIGQYVQAGQPLMAITGASGFLGRRQLQRNAAGSDAAGTAGGRSPRRIPGREVQRPSRLDRGSDGRPFRVTAAGQRHRKLRQSHAARAGKNHGTRWAELRESAAAGAQRVCVGQCPLAALEIIAAGKCLIMAETGFRRWIVVITVITATIIELIDTSIVNVALTEMSGNLGATLEDISWVVTAYAIANVIIIPMTGFLASFFGRKRYYLGSIILFTAASVFCGTAGNLWELVLFRFLQGIGGGALLSTSQAILFEAFSEEERGTAGGIFSLGVILGPTIGPTLGGWIVDNYSWPWIFYVNLPIGVAAALLTISFIHDPPHAQRRPVKIVWMGIGLLAAGLASLQYVLERGESEDWFDAPHIVVLTALTIVTLVGFVGWELKTSAPVVNLRVLKSRSLAIAAGLTFMIGFGLFGSTYVVPVFAQRILGMTALDTGLLMMPGALAAMVVAPISGRLVQRGFPPQLLVLGGFSIFAFFCFRMSHLSTDMGREHFFWPLILRGVGIASLSVPLTTLAVSGLKGRDLAQGTALNNMMRQLGGSFGIALINTYVANRAFINRSHLSETVNVFEYETQSRVAMLSAAFEQAGASVSEAQQRALAVLNGILAQQSAVISYGDTFRILALFFIGCMLAVPFLRRPRGAPVVMVSDH